MSEISDMWVSRSDGHVHCHDETYRCRLSSCTETCACPACLVVLRQLTVDCLRSERTDNFPLLESIPAGPLAAPPSRVCAQAHLRAWLDTVLMVEQKLREKPARGFQENEDDDDDDADLMQDEQEEAAVVASFFGDHDALAEFELPPPALQETVDGGEYETAPSEEEEEQVGEPSSIFDTCFERQDDALFLPEFGLESREFDYSTWAANRTPAA